jgi:hypothetical protein
MPIREDEDNSMGASELLESLEISLRWRDHVMLAMTPLVMIAAIWPG